MKMINAEKEERKQMKLTKKPSYKCISCKKMIKGNQANNNVCAHCYHPLHAACAELVVDNECYCQACASTAWSTLEDVELSIEVPRSAKNKRTKAQIEQNRLRALKIRETKLKPVETTKDSSPPD